MNETINNMKNKNESNLTLEKRLIPKKNKKPITLKEVLLTGLLFVVVTGGFIKYKLGGSKESVYQGSVSQKKQIEGIKTYDFKNLNNWRVPQKYDPNLGDPFIAPPSEKQPEVYKSLLLKGIIGSEGKESSVLIGTEIYYKGDVVEGNEIIEINEGYIKVRNEAGEISKKIVE